MIWSINIWLLIIIYIVYSIISTLLFFFTSNGWTAVILYFAGGQLVYGFGLILLLINGIYRSFKSKINSANIKINLVRATLLIQSLAVLLNQGDYGDSLQGQHLSIGKLWGDSYFYNPYLAAIGFFFLCVYLILLITLWLQIMISKSGGKLT
ncbi:MAG: hypothetical protein AAFX46_09090 [Cyanobacteria bacterium J06636_27]